jgi:hypothetical protein
MLLLIALQLVASSVGPALGLPSIYDNFVRNNANFTNCSAFPVAELVSQELEAFCSVPPPAPKNVNETRWLAKKENRAPVLCYTLFMTVWSLCLQKDSKVTWVFSFRL